MIYHSFQQGSEEWHAARLGKFTGSNFHIFLGKSETRTTELFKKAAERITGERADQDCFKNGHTERGHDLEPLARKVYEYETLAFVEEIGFIEADGEAIGCSPDGLIGSDGLLEIKCPDQHTFLKWCQDDYIKPEYRTQIQFNLMVSERQWCDFVLFNRKFGENSLKIIRVNRDEVTIEKIKTALRLAEAEISEMKKVFFQKNLIF